MLVFIDFDDVIFNSRDFKEDLKNVFLELGVSENLYFDSYYDPQDGRRVKVYDPRAQAQRIGDGHNIETEKMLRSVDVFMQDCSKYVFDDVENFIGKIGKENICLLSYGDIYFQQEKINKSGIGSKIENIFVTDKLKSEKIEEILNARNANPDQKIFFIDDRIEQIKDVKEKFSSIVTVFLKRPEGRYQEMQKEKCCDYQASNLAEALSIILHTS